MHRAGLSQNEISQAEGAGLDADTVDILFHASLAPSGHNTQPWVVAVNGPGTWTIGLDPRRRLPQVDPESREALLSIEAFVENLILSAGARGYDAHIEIIAKGSQEPDILRVHLKKVPKKRFSPLQ